MRTRSLVAIVLSMSILFVACGDDAADPPSGTGGEETAVDGCVEGEARTTDSGLEITDTKCGDGAEAKAGDTVVVHYTGKLEDGTVFDTSTDGEPIPLEIGTGFVIQGWDEGVPGMKVGGERTLVIPPDLGYGPQGQGPIPPNATLTFEIELVSIQAAGG